MRGRPSTCRNAQSGCRVPQTTCTAAERFLTRSREDERPILSADHLAPRHTHCPLTPNPPLAPARGRGVGGEGATSPCRDVQSGCRVLQTPATAAERFLTRSREDERPILSADPLAPRHTHCPLTPNPPLAPARGRGAGGEGATSPCRDVQSGCPQPTAHRKLKTEN